MPTIYGNERHETENIKKQQKTTVKCFKAPVLLAERKSQNL